MPWSKLKQRAKQMRQSQTRLKRILTKCAPFPVPLQLIVATYINTPQQFSSELKRDTACLLAGLARGIQGRMLRFNGWHVCFTIQSNLGAMTFAECEICSRHFYINI